MKDAATMSELFDSWVRDDLVWIHFQKQANWMSALGGIGKLEPSVLQHDDTAVSLLATARGREMRPKVPDTPRTSVLSCLKTSLPSCLGIHPVGPGCMNSSTSRGNLCSRGLLRDVHQLRLAETLQVEEILPAFVHRSWLRHVAPISRLGSSTAPKGGGRKHSRR